MFDSAILEEVDISVANHLAVVVSDNYTTRRVSTLQECHMCLCESSKYVLKDNHRSVTICASCLNILHDLILLPRPNPSPNHYHNPTLNIYRF